uniref:Exonuclease domain-containing protein n=1 Tax=Arundo donax TaxID=35708 RepID=A0A0A9A2J7_ARUDO
MARCESRRELHSLGEFDLFVVVDFEATCSEHTRIYLQEIIEFPAVLVDAATGHLLSAFRAYVRPRHHPRLIAFCAELTGIRQDQVDGGVDLREALAMHDACLAAAGAAKNPLAVVTWGDWDRRTMLESECRFMGLAKPAYFDRWVNLRVPFEAAYGAGRRNVQEAVREAGLQWDGRRYCGLDDARNTAPLLTELMRRGITISIADSLAPAAPEEPPQPEQKVVGLSLSTCGGGAGAAACCCYCGVASKGGVMIAPGPMQGRCFYGRGNWTPAFGAMCPFSSGRPDGRADSSVVIKVS